MSTVQIELAELSRLQAVAAWAKTIVESGRAGDDTTATFIGELARALESAPEGDLVVASMAELDEWRAETEFLRAIENRVEKASHMYDSAVSDDEYAAGYADGWTSAVEDILSGGAS